MKNSHQYIGQISTTPLVSFGDSTTAKIWCKLEFLNPSGSTKDRIARYILEKAEREGKLESGAVVEASSGSTSIALALVCAQMGLSFTAVIPDTATSERLWTIKAYGGNVHIVSGGMTDAITEAKRLAAAHGWFHTNQFENPDNVEAHSRSTASEILSQIPDGRVDAVVCGVGTGGTLLGLHQRFIESGCSTMPFAAIPKESLLKQVDSCSMRFSSKIPGVLDCISTLYNEWSYREQCREIVVNGDEAIRRTRDLHRMGFPVGPSSGLNYAAALAVAEDLDQDAQIVTVFPDRMERYFSHRLFDEIKEELKT